MYNSKQRVPTYFGKLGFVHVPDDRHINQGTTITQSFVNQTGIPVTIVHRSGLKIKLDYDPAAYSGNFVVRTEITLAANVKPYVKDILSRVHPNDIFMLNEIRHAAQHCFEPALRNRDSALIVDEIVSLETLRKYGNSVYLYSTDIIASIANDDDIPNHPFDGRSIQDRIAEESQINPNKQAFSYQIEIIDNEGEHNPRYVNINGNIFKVPISQDPIRPDGIYILSNWHSKPGRYDSDIKLDRYPLSEIDNPELKLYKNVEEARTLGDPVLERKRVIEENSFIYSQTKHQMEMEKAEMTTQINRLDLQLKQRNVEYEQIKAERDEKIAQLEFDRRLHEDTLNRLRLLEKDTLERNSMYRKEQSEDRKDRSERRKESIEFMRMLPAIFLALGGMILTAKNYL